ncbi:MAG: hypothetical protein AAF604_02830 [Acidobacteriota bacterium]
MDDNQRRERRYWMVAFAVLGSVYVSAGFVRPVANFLRDQGLLRVTVGGLFAATGLALVLWLWRRGVRPRRHEVIVYALLALVYGFIVWRMHLPEEALHYLEYGLFGALAFEALGWRFRRTRPATPRRNRLWLAFAGAVGLTLIGGWGEEILQHFLPERYYDLRDVVINATAGFLGAAAGLARELLAERSS